MILSAPHTLSFPANPKHNKFCRVIRRGVISLFLPKPRVELGMPIKPPTKELGSAVEIDGPGGEGDGTPATEWII